MLVWYAYIPNLSLFSTPLSQSGGGIHGRTNSTIRLKGGTVANNTAKAVCCAFGRSHLVGLSSVFFVIFVVVLSTTKNTTTTNFVAFPAF